jgi:uncharacterized protein (TIGR00730 family)
VFKPAKSYKNLAFLNSAGARPIRILCEYEEPRQRLAAEGVEDTIVFFGSARVVDTETAQADLQRAEEALEGAPNDPEVMLAKLKAEKKLALSPYYEQARELAREVTLWGKEVGREYVVASGGGPGIMEAANRGASEVPGGRSLGLGISLPFETGVNEWVPEALAFEFHYFFTRKYWFLYPCKAMVIFPGGFGTMDEFFESLTLIQTGKISHKLPVILYGAKFWGDVLNLDALARWGTISEADLDLIHISDSVEDAMSYLKGSLPNP